MNPWELVPWALSIAVSLLIIAGPVVVLVAVITLARGKL